MVCLGRPILAARKPVRRHTPVRLASSRPATIVDSGFWTSLIPKPLRKENRTNGTKSKEWNPATFFIVMFLFIGSMSIQMIALRNQSERHSRQSTIRIGQLREAVEKLERGEDLDVDKLLGDAGESPQDTDWEAVLKALESDELSKKSHKDGAKRNQSQRQEPVALEEKLEKKKLEDGDVMTANSSTKPQRANLGGNFF
ncbi:uncharacterized protein UV8b_06499 [Ustilaginoidea virens]|nr:uncharacterized protein UV8b_06499 [Ustilaginoidea virens]QUC22258.1 hypothetical protein UV8b_06499 [Ustilaginoidea virens]